MAEALTDINGLRFVTDTTPGIRRISANEGFYYINADGQPIVDKSELSRIKALAIPPAWTEVWICPDKNGHIQATGRDAKFRKQYRYHQRWRETRDETKYEHMISFGKALPAIRQGVASALALPGLPQEKVLATIVYLLQLTMIRIGNDEYAKKNHSYGLTTLRNKHIQIDGSELRFQFKGKSGITHNIRFTDKRLAKLIKQIRDLPGYDLFQYIDEQGNKNTVSSADVNSYMRTLAGDNYTAKDFRTWYGTIEAAKTLIRFDKFSSTTEAKQNVVQAIKIVAKKLGNTPAICRKCYVHPLVISAYLDGTLTSRLPHLIDIYLSSHDKVLNQTETLGLTTEESCILEFLEHADVSVVKKIV